MKGMIIKSAVVGLAAVLVGMMSPLTAEAHHGWHHGWGGYRGGYYRSYSAPVVIDRGGWGDYGWGRGGYYGRNHYYGGNPYWGTRYREW